MSEPVQKLTVRSALGFLVRAGQPGTTTTEIAQAFSYPAGVHES